MEYLTGRMLVNSLINLGLLEQCRAELAEIDIRRQIAAEQARIVGEAGCDQPSVSMDQLLDRSSGPQVTITSGIAEISSVTGRPSMRTSVFHVLGAASLMK